MADDLVRELRRIAQVGLEGAVGYWSGDHVIDPERDWATLQAAADKIERLTADSQLLQRVREEVRSHLAAVQALAFGYDEIGAARADERETVLGEVLSLLGDDRG